MIEEMLKLPMIYFPEVSHKKDRVAFYWDRTGRVELWVQDLRTRKVSQVSHGEPPRALRAGFVWLRNDQSICFARDRDGNEQHNLFNIGIEDGKVEQLTHEPERRNYPVDTSPDGKYLGVLVTKVKESEGVSNLHKLNLSTKELIELTSHKKPVFSCVWGPEYIAYSTNESENMLNQDIYLVRSDGSDLHKIISMKEGSEDFPSKWSGKLLAFTTNVNGIDQAAIYNVETKETRLLGNGQHEESAEMFIGNRLICTRNCDAKLVPVIYGLEDGSEEILNFPDGLTVPIGPALDDRYLIAALNTPTAPDHLVAYNLRTSTMETIIAPEYGSLRPADFVEPKYIKYRSNGMEIPAILYEPPGKGKKPGIIEVHGGPWGQFLLDFDPRAQVFVHEGFAVLQPNIRGSTGYGKEFRDMDIKDWGGGDLGDVGAAFSYLKTLPNVDPERIGIWGGSYGGYMTLMALTKLPGPWKAGCAAYPISHLKRWYDASDPDFKNWIESTVGDPEKDKELFEDRSALNFADRIQAPLLIISGLSDPRCPVEQARIFRDRLVKLEKHGYEYIEYGEEGHGGGSDQMMRIRMTGAIINFFKRML